MKMIGVFSISLIFIITISNINSQVMRSYLTTTVTQLKEYLIQWKADYLSCDNLVKPKICRVKMAKSGYLSSQTTSEGQSFGMIIMASISAAVDGDTQPYFDALFRFAQLHPSINEKDYNLTVDPLEDSQSAVFMSWFYHESFPDQRESSRFTADSDMIYALYLARSYSIESAAFYDKKIKILLSKLKEQISYYLYLPYLGDWINKDYDEKAADRAIFTTGAFQLSNFFRFFQFSNDDTWRIIINRQISLMLGLLLDSQLKLPPDYFYYVQDEENFWIYDQDIMEKYDSQYYLNACLIPLRLGNYDYKQGDMKVKRVLYEILSAFKEKLKDQPENIAGGYNSMNLESLIFNTGEQTYNLAFIAPLAVAAMVDYDSLFVGKNNPEHMSFKKWQISFLNKIEKYIAKSHTSYYEDTIILMSILTLLRKS